MTPRVVRKIERPARHLVDALGDAGVATIHEAMGREGLLQPYLRPIYTGAEVAGPAVTVLTAPGDNLMIHAAVETCEPGDVLVVAVTSTSTDGMFGELLATSFRAHGVVGLVIDAGVRDVRPLTDMGFPVWARAVSAQGTVKATPGSVNVPVVCAGAVVAPGDVVVAADDGVVCVPFDRVGDTVERCRARIAREDATRAELAAGRLGVDLYGLREKLSSLGVVYEDGPPPRGRHWNEQEGSR